jgi:hypothetical protein
MRLREHTGLHRNGVQGWPSSWIKIAGPGERCITGEPGILNGVTLSRLDPPTACYVEVEIASSTFMATIVFAQPEFCLRAYEILRTNIGKPISEIGDMDVP